MTIHDTTTSIAVSVEALRYRILAAEVDINALAATRTDTDAIQRTKANSSWPGLRLLRTRHWPCT